MLSKREKILLFLLYFLITTVVPVVILANDVLALFEHWGKALFGGFAIAFILFVVGKYESKQMPSDSWKLLGWFISPIIIFALSLVFFGFESFVESLKFNGMAVAFSLLVVCFLIQIRDLWSKFDVVLGVMGRNFETYKIPLLLMSSGMGIMASVAAVIVYVPYPKNFEVIIVFLISTISNSILFYRTERPKMI